jgi:outer membrane protein insertion porin family
MWRKSQGLASFLFLLLLVLGMPQKLNASENKIVVEFEGNKVFPSERLLKKLNLCLAKYADSPDEYRANEFEYCLRNVQSFLRSQGYLRSVVGEPKVQKTENGLKITVPIEEGALYRLGNIKLEGAKVFSPEQLLEKLNLKTGEVADGEAIGEWLSVKMKKAYADKGYIQSDFDVEPEFKIIPKKVNEGLVNLKIVLSEGIHFTVRRITFEGNENVPDQVLRNALLIKEDEPFNEQRLIDSVKNLNDLDLFEWIDKDRDVDLRTNEEDQRLDIKVRVKERSKR